MPTGTINITGTMSRFPGGGAGGTLVNSSYSNTSSPTSIQSVNLSTTPTALTIPAGTRYIVIIPPTTNTINILAGGTGVALANMLVMDPVNVPAIPMPAASPVLLLACASGTVTGVVVEFY